MVGVASIVLDWEGGSGQSTGTLLTLGEGAKLDVPSGPLSSPRRRSLQRKAFRRKETPPLRGVVGPEMLSPAGLLSPLYHGFPSNQRFFGAYSRP